jgi:Rad3-related DNA helicase
MVYSVLCSHVSKGSAPLLLQGGTGIGKTRAYCAAAAKAVAHGKRIAIAVPTWQLANQLLTSGDLSATCGYLEVAAFLPRRAFVRKADYEAHRKKAMHAPIMIVTHANLLIDSASKGAYSGAYHRDYLIIDEAHALSDAAALRIDLSIPKRELDDLRIEPGTALCMAQGVLNAPGASSEQRAIARAILGHLENGGFGISGLDGEGGLCLYHKTPGRLLKRLANQATTAFISATLTTRGSFVQFCRSLGIASSETHNIEPAEHGDLTFVFRPLEVQTDAWRAAIVEEILNAPRPCLVLVPSHELASDLKNRVPQESSLHITASDWAGVDAPRRWASLIIPKVPFSNPKSVDGHYVTNYQQSASEASRMMKQAIGRTIRASDSKAVVIILDGRAQKIPGFVPDRFLASWRTALSAPRPSYQEGARHSVSLNRPIRNPALRAAALKRYGSACMRCSFTAVSDRQLEVHHKFPIALGARATKLEDVEVICRNCHGLLH